MECERARKHFPDLDIEDVGDWTFSNDIEVFLASIAISQKRLADAATTVIVSIADPAPPAPVGCICPAGANLQCHRLDCPRKAPRR